MEPARESDVISLGDEEEIQSNPSPGPVPVEGETSFEREITKIMDDSTLGGDWTNTSIPSTSVLNAEAENTLEKAVSEQDSYVDGNASSKKNEKPQDVEKSSIEVINLDSSTETEKDNKDQTVDKKDEASSDADKDNKFSDSKITLAGDFGLALEEIKVEDEDESETLPKIIMPFGKLAQLNEDDDDEDDVDFEDETIAERICALSEMFPDRVRNGASMVCSGTLKGVKGLYGFTRAAVWICATSALILAAPVMIQSEMTQLEEMNKQQQRQILLGPNAASPGGMSPSLAQPMR